MVLYLLESMEKLSGVSTNLRRVLKSLADLFVLYGIAENSGSFLEVRKICIFAILIRKRHLADLKQQQL